MDKALLTLSALAAVGPDGVPLGDLATRLGHLKPSLHRTLAALRHRGFAEQAPDGSYRLGPAAIALGSLWTHDDNLPALLRPTLSALCAATGELVHLGVLAGPDVVYLDKVEPERAVRVRSSVGLSRPAATTALGRALLACDPAHDASEIADARARGWSQEREENEAGIACVGLAVLRDGAAVAAVSVTVPVERLPARRAAELARTAREVAAATLPPGYALAPAAR
ncbi:IclR family transcriptional regulator [Luteimicrobium subarcticum]|uniref:IclR family transcriptional regulator n=1 Tax=Luteimicrobium subarcticum TaxID=620910 RepID=UPI001FE4A388|nr:IclR family transcriptional regulator C-terminal domain-containing protein [Luteimicrobium subarcticum]